MPTDYTAHIHHKFLDLPYANTSPAQKLDIYLPEVDAPDGASRKPFPVIVSIHGGAFMSGDKADSQLIPMLEGLKRGYAVVSINYRMSGEALFPALVQDAKAAIRWIRAEAGRWNFDPQRIAAWGGSAGGYQAAMLGLSDGVSALDDLRLGNAKQSSRVQAVVDWFGPTNFLKMDEQLAACGLAPAPQDEHSGEQSPESLILGAQISTIPERVREANPETYVSSNASPFLIQHGTRDPIVPYFQSVDLAEKLRATHSPNQVTLDLLEGAGHGGPQFDSPQNLNRVFAFLDWVLK